MLTWLHISLKIINVYNQQYESGAQFWPSVHGRIIIALIVSQLLLIGLLSTKGFEETTPVLLVLPVLTFWFYKYCKNRFEPAFVRNPLQVMCDRKFCILKCLFWFGGKSEICWMCRKR